MIVSVNEKNQNNYIELFTRAYNALVAEGKMEENANGRLTSLGEYYAHMLDLVNIDRNYAMIPLDEQAFEIDANTRTINVPAGFVKCTSVQSDRYAEMLVFTIDRYFDYTDLGADTEVWAQWTAPAEKGVDSVTHASVCVKDETGTTDKLRFGWILGPEVTAVPGTVKFSIRIFRKNDEGIITYSFNTLTANLTIAPVLDPAAAEEPNVDDPEADNIFTTAIINSMYAPNGGVLPQMPTFAEPGLNFEDGAIRGLVNDTYTLEAQAVVPDAGVLAYSWQYSENGDVWANANGTIGEDYKEIPADKEGKYAERVRREVYYEKVGDDYVIYTGEFPVTKAEKTLYEKVSTYTVAEEGKVAGYYRAGATNTVGNNTTKVVYSKVCQFPEPQPVVYTTDLGDNATIGETTKKVDIGVEVAEDKGNPTMTYVWKYSNVSAAAVADETGAPATAEREITAPGWYQVDAIAALNRETQNKLSKVCRVTNPVAPLAISRVATATWPNAEELTVLITDKNAEYELKVGINTPITALVSDDQAYVWEIQEEDQAEWTVITENTPNVVGGIGTDTLKVKYADPYQNFRCTVINTLNDKTATSSINFQLRAG